MKRIILVLLVLVLALPTLASADSLDQRMTDMEHKMDLIMGMLDQLTGQMPDQSETEDALPTPTPSPAVEPVKVNLTQLNYLTRADSSVSVTSSGKDNLGNHYSSLFDFDCAGDISYYLNGQYSKFTGTVALSERRKDTSGVASLQIYGDDMLIYESPEIGAGFIPTDFEVDVSGVKVLRLYQQNLKYGLSYGTHCVILLANPFLMEK